MALTLNNLGNLDWKENCLEEARQHYEEALKTRRELAQDNSETYLGDVAKILSDLGHVDFEVPPAHGGGCRRDRTVSLSCRVPSYH